MHKYLRLTTHEQNCRDTTCTLTLCVVRSACMSSVQPLTSRLPRKTIKLSANTINHLKKLLRQRLLSHVSVAVSCQIESWSEHDLTVKLLVQRVARASIVTCFVHGWIDSAHFYSRLLQHGLLLSPCLVLISFQIVGRDSQTAGCDPLLENSCPNFDS